MLPDSCCKSRTITDEEQIVFCVFFYGLKRHPATRRLTLGELTATRMEVSHGQEWR
jgi:hypothetical protein